MFDSCRTRCPRVFVLLVFAAGLTAAPSSALAEWSPAGNPVCIAPGAQHDAICALPWIAWTDERDGIPQAYATRFEEETGELPFGMPLGGIPAAPSAFPQHDLQAIGSGWDGSLLLAWSEDRGAGSGADLYLQSLTRNGTVAPGWPESGLRVCAAAGDQRNPRLLRYFAGSDRIFVTWEDSRSGAAETYGIDVGWNGALSANFPADGLALSSGPAAVRNAALESLGGSSILAIWEQGGVIRAQTVSASDTVLTRQNRPIGGVGLSASGVQASHAISSRFPAGGILVAWQEERGGHTELYAQGWNGLGVRWETPGPVAIENTAPGYRLGLRLRPVSTDRVLAYWQDQRSDAGDIYYNVLTVVAGNTLVAGPAGQPLITAPGRQGAITVVGGAIDAFFTHPHGGMFWEDSRSAGPRAYGVFDALELHGFPMCSVASTQTQLSASYQDGVFIPEHLYQDVVVWTDTRNPATAPDLYAQLIGRDRPAGVDPPSLIPIRTRLSGTRPSPSRGAAEFVLELAQDSDVALDVQDVMGRVIRDLSHGSMSAGSRTLRWDGHDAHGARVRPGIYWVRGHAGGEPLASRVVMLGD